MMIQVTPPPLTPNLPSLGTAMEYWEHTKARAQATLPVWQQYIPTFKVNGQTATNLDTFSVRAEGAGADHGAG
jgi:hypothetical protein